MAELADWSGGGIDILVNNADPARGAAARDAGAEVERHPRDQPVLGLYTMRGDAGDGRPRLRAGGQHRLRCMAWWPRGQGAHVASKFGIVGLSKVAALEYAAQGSRDSGGSPSAASARAGWKRR